MRSLSTRRSELERLALDAPPAPGFRAALRSDHVAIIAEVKRASPSRGTIRGTLDAGEQAASYERGGAAALSILTEPTRFAGSNNDLIAARSKSSLPMLKKDFHVDPIQLIEAKGLGASAALVIVRAVSPGVLVEMAAVAKDIRLELVFEVRTAAELRLALANGAELVGINNRDLETLEIDSTTAPSLLPSIPQRCIAIAESGFRSVADIERVAGAGADAVLIGSELSSADDPEGAVRSLVTVRSRANARQD